ncbi:electrogenic sodium bicarbonate cotransporter 1-like isoform X2 [Lethenteron reissneri]|uniref:electrogenic sodium bicarbonate cotransporter 1-like isoform X2 n=1 Tax=Lethenteron reissneri TaxID=7753 RepID=UPI002AB5DF34|nr:electrogenic sodium bicarbonate cotransporter 1-like isoform X2 [Lethenteron reissneri]
MELTRSLHDNPRRQRASWLDQFRMEDEAVVDRGYVYQKHKCDDEEVEGHHAIYIGVHVPRGHRRKRRHRRRGASSGRSRDGRPRAGSASDPSDAELTSSGGGAGSSGGGVGNGECVKNFSSSDDLLRASTTSLAVSPAYERIRYILGDEEDVRTPQLFTELDELAMDGDEMEWKETARWLKFEEKVEEGGERWSKPHVATLSLHSLFELRTCLQSGTVLLDLEAHSLPQIIECITERQIVDGLLRPEQREQVTFTLLRRHRHQTKKSNLRSLADIGKSVSGSSRGQGPMPGANFHRSTEDVRLRHSQSLGRLNSPGLSRRSLGIGIGSLNDISDMPGKEQMTNKFMKKIPPDAEASNVLVGELELLERPLVAFVRLQQAVMLGSLTEVPVPTRFLFILLGPKGKAKSYHEIGRAIATLMSDEVFHDVAYKARDREDLIAGIDEFLDEVIVLPPGEWDPNIRIEPPKTLPSPEKRKSHFSAMESGANGDAPQEGGDGGGGDGGGGGHGTGEELQRTGRLFGGLFKDIKRKLPFFCSDIYDALSIQSLSATLFIYLATITNAITFGGLLGDATDNMQGVLESFLGTALSGAVFCLFAGQPLIILSSTGPVLVFERLLFNFSKENDFDYLEFRLWIGLWSAFMSLILVATDASYLVQYFTRFTEEGFSALISFIFIYDAIKKMLGLFNYYPINLDYKPDYVTLYSCSCQAPDPVATTLGPNDTVLSLPDLGNATGSDWSALSKKECYKYGGSLNGKACKFVPDVALVSLLLFMGTYYTTMALKRFKTGRYFPTTVRKLISDFSIIFSILLFCGLDALVGLETPKLIVPSEFKPTSPKRGWFVPPFGGNPWWVYLVSAVPAILITILVFMDQQITAIIVNRKENKLKKGSGYHLDLFWVAVLMATCSFLGLPWYVAATVLSIAHIDSLKMETETSAPGEQPKFLGVREQRITGVLVFVLTGVSVFLAPILKFIPMPVLYGVFLYMGVASLNGVQFMDRIALFMMPAKHQPDFIYLRHVPLRRIHLFTFIQIVCLAVLWVLKSTVAAIIFPVMVLALLVVRKTMECVFSQHDLSWLDDIMPEKDKKKKEDEKKKNKKKNKKKKSKGGTDSESDDEKLRPIASAEQLRAELLPNSQADLKDRRITLHLKISCPSPTSSPKAQVSGHSVPQFNIQVDSDCDTDPDKPPLSQRDRGGETML